jgi:dTMP kinase
MRKRFIALEGIDGGGKTTLRKRLFTVAGAQGLDLLNVIHLSWLRPEDAETITAVRFRRQPRPVAQVLRAYVADKESLADRIVRPHLRYRHVLSDRYIASDMVYTEMDAGIAGDALYEAYCSGRVEWPDVIVFVDTPAEVACERMRAAGEKPSLEYQQGRSQAFREILLGDRFPQLRPVIHFENTQHKDEGLRAFEQLMLPLLRGGEQQKPTP